MQLSWSDFKTFVDNRSISIQYLVAGSNYWMKAIDSYFTVECLIPTDPTHPDAADFIANYQAQGNRPTSALVTTQFEQNNKDLKLACIKADVDSGTKIATALLKVPGTPGTTDGRYVAGGEAWFDTQDSLDNIRVYITDVDNILGYGAGFVAKSYSDDELDPANQGWFIPAKFGHVSVEPIGGYGFIPAGLYFKIVGTRVIGAGSLFLNLFWGKLE